MNRTKTAATAIISLFTMHSFCQESYLLKYNWQEAQVQKIKASVIAKIITPTDYSDKFIPLTFQNNFSVTAKVLAIDNNSNSKFQYQIDDYVFKMGSVDISKFEVKHKRPAIIVTYDQYGNIVSREAIKNPSTAVDPTTALGGFPFMLINLPDHPVKLGETWTIEKELDTPKLMGETENKIYTKMNYQLLALEDRLLVPCYKIQLTFSMPLDSSKSKGKGDGTALYWLDRQSLEMVDCTAASDIEMTVQTPATKSAKASTSHSNIHIKIMMHKNNSITPSSK